ncbi:ABC transporter, cobalt import, CbiO [Syntrophomonas zehnderi OL-4]|uniref:ABC transporter, cobalt import, CbiO n=1 Tax=Syntrophomonas zehnderi OL-4 TaxID=690567 RepID=A0A0E4GED8_9FIRM|nr:energy-coupling factor transporter ATPase [Syntrophomonas zehnderi]CFX85273.1 ABC transporter, cobalt import, CbiO [Syntrophomonas zehnderi OL-4]
MANLIRVKNLTFKYEPDQPPILQDLETEIAAGEYLALIGPNGSGKTTLIRHFNALLVPAQGEVRVDDLLTSNPKNLLEIRRRVGMVFQNPDNQIVGMSVEEDVAFGPGNLGLPSAEVRRRVDHSLEMVGLGGMQKRSPHKLSGGQKQLLSLAGLLALKPRVIVLDEPTASLDPEGREKVLAMLKRLNQEGIAIIHITHNMEEAALANRILVMDKGQIIADGRPGDILSQVSWLKSLGLAPPRITELMWQLKQAGEDVDTSIFTIDAAREEIMTLLARPENQEKTSKLQKAGNYV